jgi:Uma2 family endonuclease
MNWQEVCEHPSLQDLPFKIELNEHGAIVMSPVKLDHSVFQAEILYLLKQLLTSGKAAVECAIQTEMGTKVADVAWLSEQRFRQNKHKTECVIAPEICVEVVSSSNTTSEMQAKRQLYFENGAEEVWTCGENGRMAFYAADGELARSRRVPDFPTQIEI